MEVKGGDRKQEEVLTIDTLALEIGQRESFPLSHV